MAKSFKVKEHPHYVDLLEVDKPIAAQSFGCFSFISPENILKQKNMYLFGEFVKKWEMNKSMEKFIQFLFLKLKSKELMINCLKKVKRNKQREMQLKGQ